MQKTLQSQSLQVFLICVFVLLRKDSHEYKLNQFPEARGSYECNKDSFS